MLKLIILWKLQRSNHSYKYTVLWFNWKALNWLLSDMFFTIFQYHKQSQHIHNNIKSTSNDNSCHISVVPSRITFKLLQGRGYRLIRSLLLSIFPNQSFTELSIPNCKSYPVLFHLYIMTFSHTCTHIQTHTHRNVPHEAFNGSWHNPPFQEQHKRRLICLVGSERSSQAPVHTVTPTVQQKKLRR